MRNYPGSGIPGRYARHPGCGLIADHFRRWWWLQLFGVLYALMLGWALAMPADASEYWHGKHLFLLAWLKTQNIMFVAEAMFLAVFSGAMLLLFDLQRGLGRAAAVLPMTGRQLGRNWWLATVAVPAAVQIACFVVAAGMFHIVFPNTVFAMNRLILGSAVVFVWLGVVFVTYFTNYTQQNAGGNGGQKLRSFIVTVPLIWLVFGFSLKAQKEPSRWVIFFALGLMLTAYGWWRAGKFIPGQGKQVARGGTAFSKFLDGRAPSHRDGPSGIRVLIGVTSVQAFLMSLALAFWMPLAMAIEGHIKSWPAAVEMIAGLVAGYWVITFFCLTPFLRHLRYLRTLPLSADRLAGLIILVAILPLLALGLLGAAVAWLSADSAATFHVVRNFTFVLCPASLCMAMAVWRGTGLQTYAVLIPMAIGVQWFCLGNKSMELAVAAAAGGLLLAFLLTRYALRHSSHAYRPPVIPFGEFPLGNK
jgi:hypothetical protein